MRRSVQNSKAERLFRLFDSPGKRDGMARLAEAIGVSVQTPFRWAARRGKDASGVTRGNGGVVPASYNQSILEAADALGVDRAAVAKYLDMNVCRTCGQPLPGRRQ